MCFNTEFIIIHLQRFKPAVKEGRDVMVSYSVLNSDKSEYTSFKNGDKN